MSKLFLENKTGYNLIILHGKQEYKALCGEKVILQIERSDPKPVKVSIDADNFDKIMFSSRKAVTPTLDRAVSVCYITKFDMFFCDADVVTTRLAIKQEFRRFEYDVLFLLLTLDVDMATEYGFNNQSDKKKFTIFNILNFLLPAVFYFITGCVGLTALSDGFEAVNIFIAFIGVAALMLLIRNIKKRYKLVRFNKYYKDILYDSVACLPFRIRKRTVYFSDSE